MGALVGLWRFARIHGIRVVLVGLPPASCGKVGHLTTVCTRKSSLRYDIIRVFRTNFLARLPPPRKLEQARYIRW